jgi:hypothetical protein
MWLEWGTKEVYKEFWNRNNLDKDQVEVGRKIL